MKKKIILFCNMFAFIILFAFGCSKEKITKVELIDDDIITTYIIGEDITINKVEIKATYTDNSEKNYTVENENITIGSFDNTKLGEQDVEIHVKHEKIDETFFITITFILPESVLDLIEDIDSLPEEDLLDLTYISTIEAIYNDYISLDDFYKTYVTNYDKYLSSKDYLDDLRDELINDEVIAQINEYKANLTNHYNALNRNNYTVTNWNTITNIYNEAMSKINLDENYAIVLDIVNKAKEDMNKVLTNSQLEFNNSKLLKIDELNNYKKSLDSDSYSETNWNQILNILNTNIEKIAICTTTEKLAQLYNETIASIDSVLTIEEEEQLALENLISLKITELTNYYNGINKDAYSPTHQAIINNKYYRYVTYIENALTEEQITAYINNFKTEIDEILTIEEENEIILNNYKSDAIKYLNDYKNTIVMYDYDSQNQTLIKNIFDSAINEIELKNNTTDIDTIKNSVKTKINAIPTMTEQAQANLINKINNAKTRLDNFASNLIPTEYTNENWQLILSLIDTHKTNFENNITISTSDVSIDNMVNTAINQIDAILTIEEEYELLLENTKTECTNRLTDYYRSLNAGNYDSDVWEIITNRINGAVETIRTFENVNDIVKLTNDTINAIESVA